MLREAKKIMQKTGGDFLVTGEVLGQRPMSQRKDMLSHMDSEAGVTGLVVRPLSGKLLTPTDPEKRGFIRREDLYDFSGRSRKPQIALADAFGLTSYPAPAGGCLLTEPNFAFRLRDLLQDGRVPTHSECELMKVGRHFRVSPSCRIVVGRDERENETIESLAAGDDCLLRVDGVGSPVTLVTGEVTDHALQVAASLCIRYSDAKKLEEAEVLVQRHNETSRLMASPAGAALIEALRIGKKPEKPATS
jgi:tRNA U34 2-thiouridine synthase MnmA/TrmU